VALEKTASISTNTIGSVGRSGLTTLLTRKCFCFDTGVTAVHLVSSNFLGFKGFMVINPTGFLTNGYGLITPYYDSEASEIRGLYQSQVAIDFVLIPQC